MMGMVGLKLGLVLSPCPKSERDFRRGLWLGNNAATVTMVSNYPGGDQASNEPPPADITLDTGQISEAPVRSLLGQ